MKKVLLSVLLLAFIKGYAQNGKGKASYYADKFNGRITASGEIYDPQQYTAAHPSLPFGTTVKVINLVNNKKVVVRINDRGPFVKGRIIDLSRAAAKLIGLLGPGIAPVSLIVITPHFVEPIKKTGFR